MFPFETTGRSACDKHEGERCQVSKRVCERSKESLPNLSLEDRQRKDSQVWLQPGEMKDATEM